MRSTWNTNGSEDVDKKVLESLQKVTHMYRNRDRYWFLWRVADGDFQMSASNRFEADRNKQTQDDFRDVRTAIQTILNLPNFAETVKRIPDGDIAAIRWFRREYDSTTTAPVDVKHPQSAPEIDSKLLGPSGVYVGDSPQTFQRVMLYPELIDPADLPLGPAIVDEFQPSLLTSDVAARHKIALSKWLTRSCGGCEDLSKSLSACRGCYQKWYCSTACQKQDWKRHKVWCNSTPRATPQPVSTNVLGTASSMATATTVVPNPTRDATTCHETVQQLIRHASQPAMNAVNKSMEPRQVSTVAATTASGLIFLSDEKSKTSAQRVSSLDMKSPTECATTVDRAKLVHTPELHFPLIVCVSGELVAVQPIHLPTFI